MSIAEILNQNPRIILFDEECNLCSAWVRFVCQRDSRDKFKFASVQSDTGKTLLEWSGLPIDHYETMVYVEHSNAYFRSAAFLKIVQYLEFPWPLLITARVIPRPLRDWLYNRIALNRYRLFGKSDSCLIPSKELTKRFL